MPEIFLWGKLLVYLLFLFGLVLVIKGAGIFVDAAVTLANRIGVSHLLIGATVVSIGTTLPELAASFTAALRGNTSLALGNGMGSVICNTGLVMGILLLSRRITVEKRLYIPKCLYLLLLGFALYSVSTNLVIGRVEGLMLVAGFLFYVLWIVHTSRRVQIPEKIDTEAEGKRERSPKRTLFAALFAGGVLLSLGAWLLVENGIRIAQIFGVPDYVIGLTFIALGTSLPELATAVAAIAKKHHSLSLGNVIGANIFNLTLVIGIPASLTTIKVPPPVLSFDLLILLAFVILALIAGFAGKRQRRYAGAVFVVSYMFYVAKMIL